MTVSLGIISITFNLCIAINSRRVKVKLMHIPRWSRLLTYALKSEHVCYTRTSFITERVFWTQCDGSKRILPFCYEEK